MTLNDDVNAAIADVANSWNVVKQQSGSMSVPDTLDLVGTTAKTVQAAYLYSDIMDSSGLAAVCPQETVASVMAAFAKVVVRIIRANNGHIRSFDGDRVMGVFTGPNKENRAVTSALKIDYAVNTLLNAKIRTQFGSVIRSDWNLRQMTGIATGQTLLVKVGIRSNDDILSAGVAPNLAAKLSDIRASTSHRTAIGKGTYAELNNSNKFAGSKNMWTGPYTLTMGGKDYGYYTSNYHHTSL